MPAPEHTPDGKDTAPRRKHAQNRVKKHQKGKLGEEEGEAQLLARARELVKDMPPLTEEQREILGLLFGNNRRNQKWQL